MMEKRASAKASVKYENTSTQEKNKMGPIDLTETNLF